MKELFDKLFAGEIFTREEACSLLVRLTDASNPPPATQIGAVLGALRMRTLKGVELLGFRDALYQQAKPLDLHEFDPIDLCGTGGDGKDTFNISTAAAFVVAGAGAAVAKHGNYAFSSACGSSNVLEALRVTFPTDVEAARAQLSRAGICFLHAPHWHPAMKGVGPIRRELGFRTFFNLLGPLVNPAKPKRQLVGVANRETLVLYKELFEATDVRCTLVHSIDGYDEVSLTSDTLTCKRFPEGSFFDEMIITAQFGLTPVTAEAIRGGSSATEAAAIIHAILKNEAPDAHTAVVIANAALALSVTAHATGSLTGDIEVAKESLRSGRALAALTKLQQES